MRKLKKSQVRLEVETWNVLTLMTGSDEFDDFGSDKFNEFGSDDIISQNVFIDFYDLPNYQVVGQFFLGGMINIDISGVEWSVD